MSNQDSSGRSSRPDASHGLRIPPSLLFWSVVLIGFILLFLWRLESGNEPAEWDQSEFERHLVSGDVRSVTLEPADDAILLVTGEYRLSEAERKDRDLLGTSVGDTRKFTSRVIRSETLDGMLRNTKVTIRQRSSFDNLLSMILPVLVIGGIIYFLFSRQIRMANHGAMQFGKSRARMIPPGELNVHFKDVAGADEAKEEVQEIVEYLKDPLKFKLLGGRIPRGCLLVGPPGTGKTMLAKAVACEANVPFFSISGSDFVEMFVGVGASRVRDMFENARQNCPCLIFIDEIDAVGRSRFSGLGGGHDEREQTLNAMLVEMDGLEDRCDVIVLAATNRPDVLDPALLRPGRFDRQVVLDLPDIRGRRQILDVHAKKIRLDEGVDLDVIAKGTPGFSGADLANLCNEAALLAARLGRETVRLQELEEARDKVCWGREWRSRKISEKQRKLTAFHEAGHALVGLHCEHCTPLHKITIIPRGQAFLGATFSLPKEDVYTRTKSEMFDEMTSALGGRVAEELIFEEISTGAAQDIAEVSRMARMMVCVYGMDEKIGPIKYGDFREHVHVRLDAPPKERISEELSREIDLEVRSIVNAALDRARRLLGEFRGELETLANALLERETLTAAEVDELLGRTPAVETEAVTVETSAPEKTDGNETPEPQTAEAAAPDASGSPENAGKE